MKTIAVFDIWLGFNPLTYTMNISLTQLLLMGWLSQVALALIYDRWLSIATPKKGAWVFLLFNMGLPLVLIGQPGLLIFGGVWLGAMAVFGAGLQLLAGVIFFYDVLLVFRLQ